MEAFKNSIISFSKNFFSQKFYVGPKSSRLSSVFCFFFQHVRKHVTVIKEQFTKYVVLYFCSVYSVLGYHKVISKCNSEVRFLQNSTVEAIIQVSLLRSLSSTVLLQNLQSTVLSTCHVHSISPCSRLVLGDIGFEPGTVLLLHQPGALLMLHPIFNFPKLII